MFEAHFVAAQQQVGDFEVVSVGGQLRKNGGNVAGYFCTPGGRVLHATAGPVSAEDLLEAAHWAVARHREIQPLDPVAAQRSLAHAHRQAAISLAGTAIPVQAARRHGAWNAGWSNRALPRPARVHLLLAERPLQPLAVVYGEVFEGILGESVRRKSPHLVLAERVLTLAQRTHRPLLLVLHDPHHANGYEQWVALAANCRRNSRVFAGIVDQYLVVVLPLDELPALSRRLGQPPYEAPDSAKPLLVVARSDGRQLDALTGRRAVGRLTHALAAGLVDAAELHPPNHAGLRRITRLVSHVDDHLADRVRELSRQQYDLAAR